MNKLSDIDLSLSQGQLYGTKQFVALWIAVVSASLLIIVGIISVVLSCIEWDSEIFVVGILLMLMGIAFLSVLIYCFVKDKKIKRRVVLWLEDAEKTTAYSSKVDEFRVGLSSAVKIRVKFNLNGLTYTRESSVKAFGGRPGYHDAFKRYMDKQIRILYSVKYDEVLILKPTEKSAQL